MKQEGSDRKLEEMWLVRARIFGDAHLPDVDAFPFGIIGGPELDILEENACSLWFQAKYRMTSAFMVSASPAV